MTAVTLAIGCTSAWHAITHDGVNVRAETRIYLSRFSWYLRALRGGPWALGCRRGVPGLRAQTVHRRTSEADGGPCSSDMKWAFDGGRHHPRADAQRRTPHRSAWCAKTPTVVLTRASPEAPRRFHDRPMTSVATKMIGQYATATTSVVRHQRPNARPNAMRIGITPSPSPSAHRSRRFHLRRRAEALRGIDADMPSARCDGCVARLIAAGQHPRRTQIRVPAFRGVSEGSGTAVGTRVPVTGSEAPPSNCARDR